MSKVVMREMSSLQDRSAKAETRETRIGTAGPPAMYLRWRISQFLSLQFISVVFLSSESAACFFLSYFIAPSPRQGACRRRWLPSLPLYIACYLAGRFARRLQRAVGATHTERYASIIESSKRLH